MKYGYHSLNLKERRITKFGLEKTGEKFPVDPDLLNEFYTHYSLTLEELWREFQFLNTKLSLVSTTLNKFYLFLLTTIWRRVHEPGCGAWSFATTTPLPTAHPWCRTIWKHKDLKLYHIPRTVQILHDVTSSWILLSKSALVDANSKSAQLSKERYFNAQTVYLNVTIKAHSKTGLNTWKMCRGQRWILWGAGLVEFGMVSITAITRHKFQVLPNVPRILKILLRKTEIFQIKNSDIFHILLKT